MNNCINVQLPAALRNVLGLKTKPQNLGKEVLVYGDVMKYNTFPGIKNTVACILDGTQTGTEPVDPSGAVLNETLLTQASFDKFTAVSVIGAEVWTFSTQNYGAVMSGYVTATSQNEDWFITPAINLAGKTSATLTFDHARGPAGSMSVSTTNYTVWVSTDYTNGAPSGATWTQLTIPTHGTVAWGYVSSGNVVIPADKLTATTRIAFKYVCDNAESATWEVRNVIVK
jgi:hypothetical protein